MEEIEVFVAPLKILWVEAPDKIKKKDKIDLLQNDILLVPCTVDYLLEVKDNELQKTVILINIDKILEMNKKGLLKDNFGGFTGFLKIIIQYFSKAAIFHTIRINPKLQSDIKKLGLIYLEMNLEDMNVFKSFIIKIIHNFFQINNTKTRSFLRIQFHPKTKVIVTVRSFSQDIPEQKFFLKDLSINGMGIICDEKQEITQINMKDIVQIKVNFPSNVINIKKSVVTRLTQDKKEFGVVYDLNDSDMIMEHDSYAITEVIHEFLEQILEQHGLTYDLNFIKIKLD